MNEIRVIKCPHCSASLKIKMTEEIKRKQIKCPACGERSPFNQFIQKKQGKTPQHIEGTNYLSSSPKKSSNSDSIGQLVDTRSNQRYQLQDGTNIIGRDTATSQATVKLDTGGQRMMSREHAIIEVKHVPGKGYLHTFFLYKQEVNATRLNGMPLVYPEKVRLKDGDIIDFPDIRVRFIIPETEKTDI